MNASLLLNEITSIGLTCSRCDSSGNIDLTAPDTSGLIPLVLAAHGKPKLSPEAQTLKAAITDDQWTAYKKARKAPIEALRNARYREETDQMRLSLDEDFVVGSAEWNAGLAAWKAAKAKIKQELPYPE